MPLLKSLRGQLTLAFLLLSLLTLGLVGIFSSLFTRKQYSDLLTAQLQTLLTRELQEYYALHGTVAGFTGNPGGGPAGRSASASTGHALVPPPGRPPDLREGGPFDLLDSDQKTLRATPMHPLGSSWPAEQLKAAVPVQVPEHAAPIAYLLPTGNRPPFDDQGAAFVQSTQRAILLVMVAAALIAALMGRLLARTLLFPLRQLLSGIQTLQQGNAVSILPNLRQDEVGELVSAFNLMSQEVTRNQQVRRQLTADIAHDLNTPLSVIRGTLEGMIDGTFAVNPVKLEGLHRETLHVVHLIRDLRFLSLADAGELHLQRRPVDLWQVVRDTAQTFTSVAEQRGIDLTCTVPEHPLTLSLDPTRIVQVLQNLLSNALEHTPDAGRIELQGLEQVNHVQVLVEDTGVGIPADLLPHVFERLYRANASRRIGGSGLGLSISRSVVEAHGGQIQIVSVVDHGTTVTVTLPR